MGKNNRKQKEGVSGPVISLYGKNSVHERLKANPASVREVFLQENFDVPEILALIKARRIPFRRLTPKALGKKKHAKDLQGIVARVDEYVYSSFDDLLQPSEGCPLTLVFLDRINDPQNLGVIMRSLACLGGFAVVIPKSEACGVNETVLHVASGAENYLRVAQVTNLSQALLEAKRRGYWIMGAVVSEDAQELGAVSMPFPLGLVMGSEGKGVRPGVVKQFDIKARIPMRGAALSFNVSMACLIFCHEISKQRGISA